MIRIIIVCLLLTGCSNLKFELNDDNSNIDDDTLIRIVKYF